MAIEIQDGFYVSTALPIDARMQVASQAARDAIPALVRWEGMSVYSVGDAQAYKLVGGLTNEFWIEEGSGSGTGVIVVADIAELEAIPTEDRTDGMLVYVLDSGSTYQLRGGITNDDWAEFGQPVYIITDTEASRLAIRNNVRTFGLIVFQQDTKKTYRLGAGLTNSDWEELYLDRVNQNLEVAFQLTCDEELSSWDTVATMGGVFEKETVAPFNGDASYKFTRSSSPSTAILVSPPQPVALRFRGQINTLYFPYSYDGANDIVTAQLYDNTNNTFIDGVLPLQGTNSGISIAKMGVIIPLTCESVDVVFTFNGVDDGKILQFDDIQLTGGVDIFADIPQAQSTHITQISTFGVATITGVATYSKGAGSFTYNSTTGEYKLLRDSVVNASISAQVNGVDMIIPSVFVGSELKALSTSLALNNTWMSTELNGYYAAGTVFTFRNIQGSTKAQEISFSATTVDNPNIVVPTDTFSTDTAALTYAPSSQYTLATLENAPIGTFITFTYASGTNTRTQTTTAPTQSIESMRANGILTFTRAHNSGSSAGNPSAYAIQIGKGLKGYELGVYKNPNKSIEGSVDWGQPSTTSYGIRLLAYNEKTGVLLVDAGVSDSASTSAAFLFSDVSTLSSGYVTINAGKTPSLVGIPLQQTAYIKDVKPSGTSGGTFTAGAWQTRTLNTVEGDAQIVSLNANQFTLGPGKYLVEASAPAFKVSLHRIRIRNITTSSDTALGTSEFSNATDNSTTTRSFAVGTVLISNVSIFELQHRCSITYNIEGLGFPSSFGDSEIYTQVKITKIS